MASQAHAPLSQPLVVPCAVSQSMQRLSLVPQKWPLVRPSAWQVFEPSQQPLPLLHCTHALLLQRSLLGSAVQSVQSASADPLLHCVSLMEADPWHTAVAPLPVQQPPEHVVELQVHMPLTHWSLKDAVQLTQVAPVFPQAVLAPLVTHAVPAALQHPPAAAQLVALHLQAPLWQVRPVPEHCAFVPHLQTLLVPSQVSARELSALAQSRQAAPVSPHAAASSVVMHALPGDPLQQP